MKDSLYLAWKYLAYHRLKTVILVTSITLIVYLPVGLQVLVSQSARELTARAEATPLIIGTKGGALELVLNTLYFESDRPELARYEEVTRVADSGLARAIPIYARFQAQRHPIVGTTLEYFDFRGLRLATGRNLAMLGECLLGSEVARDLGIAPGGSVLSSPESVFDLAGVYPLKMHVAGILAPSHSPDDRAIFVDLKTAWIIEGLGHGHEDLARPEASSGILRRHGSQITANASVVQHNEITAANLASFHFHGDQAAFPVTAVIAVPHDQKSETLLRGRYQSSGERSQIVRPVTVMNDLLATILTVQNYIVAAVVLVGFSTLATATLVFLLSLRLRKREIETMVKIGGAARRVALLLASEVVVVFVLSVLLAAGLTLLTSWLGGGVIRSLILS